MSRKRYPLRVARGAYGIRAQDLRTLARKDWWARRWIASLEAMRLGPRFGRGRQYATDGQVTELVLDGPHVEATVVGSREDPYRLTLDFTAATGNALKRIAAAIAAEPMLLGRLLTDNLPTEIETFFHSEGLPLFPQAAPVGTDPSGRPVYDVKMHCSCPDWARPCKHLVAVMLLLGEEVAQRPSTLLSLRGIEVEDLVGLEDCEIGGLEDWRIERLKDCGIEGLKDCGIGGLEDWRIASITQSHNPTITQSHNPTILQSHNHSITQSPNHPISQSHNLSILKRLGPIPFWRGTARCVDALAHIYSRCQPVAADAANGKSIDLRG
jgi:uncharacterized Zn finger protein